MENKQIRPLTPTERQYATENYHLISKFLILSKLDAEEFFDFLLSVEIYLNNEALREKCNFEAVSYMYMKRAVYRHFREQKAQKRSSECGADISFNEIDAYIGQSISGMENLSSLEYDETDLFYIGRALHVAGTGKCTTRTGGYCTTYTVL